MKNFKLFVEECEFFKKRMIMALTENLREIGAGRITVEEAEWRIRDSAERVDLPRPFIQLLINKLHEHYRVQAVITPPLSR